MAIAAYKAESRFRAERTALREMFESDVLTASHAQFQKLVQVCATARSPQNLTTASSYYHPGGVYRGTKSRGGFRYPASVAPD